MKGYEIKAHQQPVKRKKDLSLTLTFHTGEAQLDEYIHMIKNDNQLGNLIFVPEGMENAPLEKITTDTINKKPSQQLRNVLFVLWKKKGEQGEFDTFYRQQMEKYIQHIKDQLEP